MAARVGGGGGKKDGGGPDSRKYGVGGGGGAVCGGGGILSCRKLSVIEELLGKWCSPIKADILSSSGAPDQDKCIRSLDHSFVKSNV